MTDFTALLDELLIDLRQPQVRDLAWTLLSPPLLQPGSPALRHPLSASRWYSQPALLAAWLHTQERSPGELLEQLESAPHQRLGRYYERLWQYALEHAPDLRLLAANLPVRDNGQTLGELDLLLEDDDGLHHLELAIKLYLGPSDDGPNAWLGPGAEDHLLRKIEHFYQHQLPLSSTTEGLAVVRQFSRAEPAPGLWLGGYLFYSWPTPCPPPVGASDNHQRGRWLHRRAWPAYHALHPHGWQALSRKAWLSPTVEDECWSAARFATWLAELPEDGFPQMLVRLEQRHGRWREQERLFLVGDRWPRVHSGYSR